MASSGKTGSNIAHLTPADIAKWPAPNYEDPDRITWMPIYSGHAGRLGLDDVCETRTMAVRDNLTFRNS
jgi:hypothetical protein